MRIVSIVGAGDDAALLDAHLAFHLNAGVDLVLAIDGGDDATGEILAAYERDGVVRRMSTGAHGSSDVRSELARRAVAEHDAEWVLSSDADEFWWPRGESLKDVLAAIPARYGVVQALVRVFPPRPGDGAFEERMTVRPTLLEQPSAPESLTSTLRPVYRAGPALVIDPGDPTEGGRRVPLRAWYPIEVLRFPFRSPEQAERFCARGERPRSELEAAALEAHREGHLAEWYAEQSAASGSLVSDVRLRDALRTLRRPDGTSSTSVYALPAEDDAGLVLRPPTIVDDAAYAGECAAVGEVDLVALDRHIRDLEARIGQLEARFWPRVLRKLTRLTRR
ncbi:MAG TPA: glycosyltransferase family 2 protein [Gaiellaceae bacterium]|nr:glycosyltransferase family 2 protein [Gaiellaceae bacterium]